MISCEVVAASVETAGVMFSVSILVPVARSIDALSVAVALTMVSVVVSADAVSMFVVTVLTSNAAEVISEVPVAGFVTLVKVVPVVVTTFVDSTSTIPVVVAAATVLRIGTVVIFATVEPPIVVFVAFANAELVSGVMCVDTDDVTETIHGLWRRSRDR